LLNLVREPSALPNRAVLFDLDGTLTDPKLGIVNSIQYALVELDLTPPPIDELLWCIGPPLIDSFARLLDTTDRSKIDIAIGYYRDRYATLGIFENLLYPQIPEVITQIRAAGYRTYVATSKPQIYAQKIVEHFELNELFDRVYGSELNGKYSIKDELIEHILTLENLTSDRTVMVGDRSYDTIGAKQNGIYSIGVTYGYGSELELRSCGTDAIIDRPEQLFSILQELHSLDR
jgi:phosphoglycolate phosphatase